MFENEYPFTKSMRYGSPSRPKKPRFQNTITDNFCSYSNCNQKPCTILSGFPLCRKHFQLVKCKGVQNESLQIKG